MHLILKSEMEKRGMTPERLAAEMQGRGAQIGSSTVRAWLDGRAVPGFRNACILSDLMGWSREEMFEAAGYTPAAA